VPSEPSAAAPTALHPRRSSVTLAHEGTKAYSEAFELVIRREADAPNAFWQADHTPLDIPPIRPDGEIAKPWLTVVIDDYIHPILPLFPREIGRCDFRGSASCGVTNSTPFGLASKRQDPDLVKKERGW
jgi:hypothetical protein